MRASLTKGCRIGLTDNQPDSSKSGLQSSLIYGRSSLTLSGNPDSLQFYFLELFMSIQLFALSLSPYDYGCGDAGDALN